MQINEFVKILFDKAREEGLEKYEAYSAEGEDFTAGVYLGEVEEYKVAKSIGVSFRAEAGGHMGYAYTERLDEESAGLLIKKAKENALAIENEDVEFMYAGGENAEVLSYNPQLQSITPQMKIDFAMQMDETARAEGETIRSVTPCKFESFSSIVSIENSLGLKVSCRSNGMGGYLGVAARDGDGVKTAMAIKFTSMADGFDAKKTALEAVDRAVRQIGATSMKSGSCKVALSPDAMSSLLGCFSSVFCADTAQKGMSLLKDKEGTVVGSEILSIIDDPHMEYGAASRPFDDEGVPTKRKAVVEKGVLTTLLHNLKTANKAGCESTGNASKAGISAPVSVSASNFYIEPGELTQAELFKKAGEGVYITGLEGLHAGADAVSGDFSLSGRGFIIHNGELERAVEGITVSGNFYTLLKDVDCVASDLEFGFPSGEYDGSPTVLIKNLSIAGE